MDISLVGSRAAQRRHECRAIPPGAAPAGRTDRGRRVPRAACDRTEGGGDEPAAARPLEVRIM